MRLGVTSLFTIALVVAVVLLPAILSFHLAERYARTVVGEQALIYAHGVLIRSEETAAQVHESVDKLLSIQGNDRCSDKHLRAMREQDLSSSNIQALGHVADNQLLCSSLGRGVAPLSLDKADLVTRLGMNIWRNVVFPFAPGKSFAIFERDGFAAIINKKLPIDVTTDETDVSLLSFSAGQVVFSRGFENPEWIKVFGSGVSYQDDGYVIALVRSSRYDIGAIAAIPQKYVKQRTQELSLLLVPMGVVAGLGLGAMLLYFARQQQALPTLIKTALRRKEFFLVYQPIVDLQSGRWVGAEVLLRWHRPTADVIRPDVFIQAAEDSGLIQDITAYVLDRVAQEADGLFKSYPDFHLGINLATADLQSAQIVIRLQNTGHRLGAKPGNLLVEVTERGFLDRNTGRAVLGEIRNNGILIAIDDFGTGYSSLAYLESFDLDYLKIDKSFVDTLGSEAATSQVVPHIIEMAKSLDLLMIAEGVENELQAQILREHGVQFAQGWLFSKPVPYFEFIRAMRDNAR